MRVFVSAGEASGDALGASLLQKLRERLSNLDAFGMGGDQLREAGLRTLFDARELGVVGIWEVLRHLPRLFRLMRTLADKAIAEHPDVAILIDAPDFHVRLAKRLFRAGIPVVFYVGPSVWAWRRGRMDRFARLANRILLLFPFEVGLWRSHGVDAVCVGHPLQDEIPFSRDPRTIDPKLVALLPGSRRSEISRLFPVMLMAAASLKAKGRAERLVVLVAPTLHERELKDVVVRVAPELLPSLAFVSSLPHDPRARRFALARAKIAIVASGTATLETALIGTPQVIVYRTHWLTWAIGRRLARIQHLGLPNILLGRQVVPELLQDGLTSAALVACAEGILDASDEQVRALEGLRRALGPTGAARHAAEAILEVVGKREREKGLAGPQSFSRTLH